MWYYACLIQLKISDRKLRRYLEPTIYAIAWLTPLISCVSRKRELGFLFLSYFIIDYTHLASCIFLHRTLPYRTVAATYLYFVYFIFLYQKPILVANDLYNPTPLESWCRQSPYPFDCLLDDQEEKSCIRGSPDVASSTQIAIIIFPIVGVVTIIVCMSMIICGSWRINSFFIEETPEDQDQQQQQQQSQNVPSQAQLLNAEWKTMKRSLVRQASMYLSAFILTWLFVIPHRVLASDNVFANFLFCIFFPLSGFYNFSIFIFHKIIIIRKNYPDTTFRNAFIGVFSRTDEVPDARISGISTIIGDNHDDPILRRSALHDALAQDGNARHTIDNVARRRRNADMQNGSNHENWSYDDDAEEEENFEASWSPGDHRQSAEIAMMFLMRWNNVDQSTVSNDNVASSEDQQKPDAVQQHTQQVVQDSNTNGDQVELFDTNLSYAVDGSIATGLSYSKNGDGDELS
jgi:hypothetical protein